MVSALTDGSFRYLSKEEIERGSPSRQDDMGVGKEAQLQATYCSFIRDVGLRVRLTKKEGSAAFESKTSSNNLRRRKKTVLFAVIGGWAEGARSRKSVHVVGHGGHAPHG
ncbi:cyclin-T1-4-like [Lolium rigidum]|uniref:cyclin-T1-4-like n=1 Tax=Lolium rigidum TaxID=89674 RepID=UPI001F5E1944|nr:cyclin-T1-4-like [Lolium rigidum]XP_051215838.1 cyclin-T1-4-like isoform X2 [Lolium perenne]